MLLELLQSLPWEVHFDLQQVIIRCNLSVWCGGAKDYQDAQNQEGNINPKDVSINGLKDAFSFRYHYVVPTRVISQNFALLEGWGLLVSDKSCSKHLHV